MFGKMCPKGLTPPTAKATNIVYASKPENIQVFEGSSWRQIEDGNYSSISKVEVQVWLTLYNILSKSICTEKYEINDYRKARALVRFDKEIFRLAMRLFQSGIPNLIKQTEKGL